MSTIAETYGSDAPNAWERLLSRGLDAWVDAQVIRTYRPNEPAYYASGDGATGFPAGTAAPAALASWAPLLVVGVIAVAVLLLVKR